MLDAATGALLDSRTLAGFHGGQSVKRSLDPEFKSGAGVIFGER